MSEYKNLQISIEGPCAVLCVARPATLNALNDETIRELGLAIEALDCADNVRGVIITGGALPQKEGKPPRHSFVSGADIAELANQGVVDGTARSLAGQAVMNRIEGCRKPVIAAVNGFCLGGGFELALACHWRYASEHAVLGLPECTIGIMPGYGGTQRLARLIGSGRAAEMICTGMKLTGKQALEWGVVNRLTTAEELLPAAKATIADAAKCAPKSLEFSLRAMRRGLNTPADEGQRIEADLFGMISSTADMREGLTAFLEKRPPVYTGK